MCTYHVCLGACVREYVYVCVCMYMCVCVGVCVCMSMYLCVCTHLCVCICVRCVYAWCMTVHGCIS